MLVLVLLTLNVFTLFSQKALLCRAWLGNELEYIRIDTAEVFWEMPGYSPEQKKYLLIKDTLRLYDRYTTSRDNFSKRHITNYDFLICGLSDTAMVLRPINSPALKLTGNRNYIAYKERHLVKKALSGFEWIKFQSTTCRGDCPAQLLEITLDRKLKFIGGPHAFKKGGFYTAIIPDSLFLQLYEKLSLANLEKIKRWDQFVSDAPEYTIEVKYNNKTWHIDGFLLPTSMHELIDYLLKIASQVQLFESKEPFIISLGKAEE